MPDYEGVAEAVGAARANLSPRQVELEQLERFALGTQYEGRPSFFDPERPLWERAPCIVYPLVDIAISSNVDLVLGEGRFPEVTSNPGEDDEAAEGLDEAQSQKVDRAIAELLDRVRFRTVSRQALAHGQQARSVAVIAGVRAGKPFLELVRSRWCEPTLDAEKRIVRLEIRYPYVKPQKRPDGKWEIKAWLYRRVIDADSDTEFLPLAAPRDGREPLDTDWRPDPQKTVEHGLGFCPVHWYAHDAQCSTVADYDGRAIHERVLEEIEGLDFALSQRHRSALFCGDPQIVETGVPFGYNPSGETGVTGVPATRNGGSPTKGNPQTGSYVAPQARPARKKSPGEVWQYEAVDTKVAYLVLPEGALEALENHAADLRNKLAEALAVVLIDPQNAKTTADMSGKAVEQLRSRQFDRCDQIRDDVGENWILPVVKLLLKIALKTAIKLPSVKAVGETLAKFVDETDPAGLMLFLRWPASYIKPGPDEELQIIQAAVAAKDAGIITTRMAVEKVSRFFGVDSVDEALEALEEEKRQAQDEIHASMAAMAEISPPPGKSNGKPGVPGRPPAAEA